MTENKKRVMKLGEVFTPDFIVDDMMLLFKDINYKSTFLEPGCGNGNFLIKILDLKLNQISEMKESKISIKNGYYDEFEHKLIASVSSIYGIDIDRKNVKESRFRMLERIKEFYKKFGKRDMPHYLIESLNYIINSNIILGDLLNKKENIVINEYTEVKGFKIKIRKFLYSDLIYPDDEVFQDNYKLFAHLPQHLEEYSSINYKEIGSLSE